MNKKRILFITESYFYTPSPNGNCVQKVAETLVGHGHEVFVLCLRNQMAKENESESINGVKVYRVNTYLDWRLSFSKKLPNIIKRVLIKIVQIIRNVLIPWHPLKAPFVLMELTRIGKKIVKENQVDTVVGVYRDFETAWAGVKLKRKLPVKCVIYTLDAISGGVCSNKLVSENSHKEKCRKWELKMLKACDVYCAMSSHKEIYQDEIYDLHKNKIVYMDVPTLIVDDEEPQSENDSFEEIRFCYTGMLSETNADCRYFLNVFSALCQKYEKVRWDIYGGISPVLMRAIENTGCLNRKIFYHGRVGAEEIKRVRQQANVFLNFGNEHFCGIPCKIFEYISTKKLIVSFYKIDNDASLPYLKRYPKACMLRENGETAEKQAEMILVFFQNYKFIRLDKERIMEEYYSNTPHEFADLLEKI